MSDTNPAQDTQIQNAANPADAPPQPKAQDTPPQDAQPKEPQAPQGVLGGDGDTPNPDEPKGAEGDNTPEPQELKIEVPDGASEELVAAFKDVAQEIELDSAKAQKIVDVFLAAEKKAVEAQQNEWRETQNQWLAEVQNDPEFGGAKFEQNKNLANRALEEYGGEELIGFLKSAGLTSFPPLVRAFVRIGQAMANDSISGKVGAPQGEDNTDPWDRFFNATDPKDASQGAE